jgi:hypothetical protein
MHFLLLLPLLLRIIIIIILIIIIIFTCYRMDLLAQSEANQNCCVGL